MAVLEDFGSFDKVLDELLKRKMNLANASLYPTDQIEVSVEELGNKVFGGKHDQIPDRIVSNDDIDTMDDYLFEAFVAALYNKQNYSCRVTPKSGDKGVDVLASGTENIAIQCKHGKTNVGNDAVQEIVAGSKYYEVKEQSHYIPCVVTNSEFTLQARELASVNNVHLIDGKKLKSMLKSISVSWKDVYTMERNRMN